MSGGAMKTWAILCAYGGMITAFVLAILCVQDCRDCGGHACGLSAAIVTCPFWAWGFWWLDTQDNEGDKK